jgi:hypothetical protein
MTRPARYLVAVLALACAVLSAAWLSFPAARRGGAPDGTPAVATPVPTDTLRARPPATAPGVARPDAVSLP